MYSLANIDVVNNIKKPGFKTNITFLLAASAAILAADFLGGLPRVDPFSGDVVFVASDDPFVLVNVVTSCLITVCPRLPVVLLLALPFLFEADWEATTGGLGDLAFLLPALLDCVFFFVFLLESTGVLSESFSLLSLNILFARADDLSLLLEVYVIN